MNANKTTVWQDSELARALNVRHKPAKTRRKTIPIAERFWSFVVKPSEDSCWPWAGALRSNGYGAFGISLSILSAHRVSWVITHGAIPVGMCVLHRCDYQRCVNPGHLFLGSIADNNADARLKKRTSSGERHGMSKLTECQVLEIRALRAANPNLSFEDIGWLYSVCNQTIELIVNRKHWTNI